MSQSPKDAAEQYLVIVRNRHGGGDDGHHGGAWKIAYADFMTAMMAFFLVMWLINATDEKTIIQVATYFNPLRLSDKVPSQKGLHEGTNEARGGSGTGGPSATGTTKPSAEPTKKEVASPSESKKKAGKKKTDGDADQQLFADPFAALDKIAAKATLAETPGDGKDKAANDPPPPVGDVVRDPYEPVVRPKGSEPTRTVRGRDDDAVLPLPKEPTPRSATAPETPKAAAPPAPTPLPAPPPAPKVADTPRIDTPQETAARLETAIRQVIAGLKGAHPMLNVTMTSEGVLIDLTDNINFSMFSVGSAEPRPDLVVVMARIGAILAKQSGAVVVKGHTDGRPYRTAAYDNWRLSSARAHMASYMLMRGGLAESRIERIEGHADRTLKVPVDKEAAQNRRIEILLKVQPP